MSPAGSLPIRRSVSVPVDPDRAFRLFTEQIGSWWPLAHFSMGGAETRSAHVEPRVGGRIFERALDGTELSWATITDWQPPRRFAATWQLSSAEQPTDLVVEFTPAEGGTKVEVIHSGWDRSVDGEVGRANYDAGWEQLLGLYAVHASSRAS